MDAEENTADENPLTVKHEILRVNLGKEPAERLKDEVIIEDRMELYVNDKHYATFSFSPSKIKELAVGHLLAEGIIDKPEDIVGLKLSKGRVSVRLTEKPKPWFQGKPQTILTACGGGALRIPPALLMRARRTKDASSFRLKPQTIFKAVETLNSQACIFRRTGGTHASALLDENGIVIAFSEDVGRHNAIDKVIGEAALNGVDFGKTLLASTGRLTFEMAVKAGFVGIPVIVSISAPTDKGIKIAEAFGLTLIGFARGRRFNVYTHPERIEST